MGASPWISYGLQMEWVVTYFFCKSPFHGFQGLDFIWTEDGMGGNIYIPNFALSPYSMEWVWKRWGTGHVDSQQTWTGNKHEQMMNVNGQWMTTTDNNHRWQRMQTPHPTSTLCQGMWLYARLWMMRPQPNNQAQPPCIVLGSPVFWLLRYWDHKKTGTSLTS